MKKYNLLFALSIFLISTQCSSDLEEIDTETTITELTASTDNDNSNSTSQTAVVSSFDHEQMLTNWADNIIIPSIINFENSLVKLKNSASIFVNEPSNETLSVLKEEWLNSFLKWQHLEMFDVGLAEEIYYKNRINLYPANVNRIENNISNQNYDLNASSNFSSQGFNGLDYLLFGIGQNEEEIILKYTSEDSKYGKYFLEIIDKMIELTTQVKDSWDDEFRDEFIKSTDNTSTSSINQVINDFIFYFEKGYRANKIAIPAGRYSDGPLPDRIEAYHGKKYSKILILEATDAIDNFYNGRFSNDITSSGLSINDYLSYMESDQDDKLAEKINEQLKKIKTKLTELNTDFSEQIRQDNLEMLITYDIVQANVVFLKVNLLQKLNINIDYADADGD
ncbi:imelysin family protein [Flavobacteriaceae bacterium]|nr:imelysin family protein [Flavobacteriaceae bacterium]